MSKQDEFPKVGNKDSVQSLEEKELIRRLKARMRSFLDTHGIDQYQKWREGCVDAINEAYPDVRERHKYRLYRAFVGGTGYYDLPEFDFPGEYSLQKMIEKLP